MSSLIRVLNLYRFATLFFLVVVGQCFAVTCPTDLTTLPNSSYSGSYSLTKATAGCAQAHCESTLQGQSQTAPPLSTTYTTVANGGHSLSEIWAGGNNGNTASGPGLGCSANLLIFACSYQGSGSNVSVYSYNYTSNTFVYTGASGCSQNRGDSNSCGGISACFDVNASSSAPIVFMDGGVVGADDNTVGYLPSGSNTWYYFPDHEHERHPYHW